MTAETEQAGALTYEQASSLPFYLHDVHWRITLGQPVVGQISCDAPPGARCRLVCAERCGATFWPCGPGGSHLIVDSGECQVLRVLNAFPLTNSYVGPPDADVCSTRVEVVWTGGSFGWKWAEPSKIRYVVSRVSRGLSGTSARMLVGDDWGPFDTPEEASVIARRLAEEAGVNGVAVGYEVRSVRYQVNRWELV